MFRVRIAGIAALAVVFVTLGSAQQAPAPVPVDDGALVGADSRRGDWLSYGRTYDEQRFSPLDQIHDGNADKLGLAWAFDTATDRGLEATPLVINGVMYTTGSWSVVYAIDARTGKQLWKFDPEVHRKYDALACCDVVNRGAAFYKGRVYLGALDGRLIAIDAKTGKSAWQTTTVDQTQAYTITGAPRIAKGKVIIGNGGAEYGVRGYVSAYDAETGQLAWRFYTVPGDPSRPQESKALEAALPTWKGNDWWKFGGGGTVWDSIVYDPEINLLYVGTGNGSVWSRKVRSPGGGDNLYLSSIVALNADTGKYAWHYQTTPGDNWDYNAAQPMILADLTIGGRVQKVLMQAPKNGFFYVLDRATGKLISGQPYVFTSWATGIDKQTGRPIETEAARYRYTPVRLSPSPVGAHHWPPMAFNPTTGFVYYPGQETSSAFAMEEKFEFKEGQWNLGIRRGTPPGAKPVPPPPPDPKAPAPGGFFVAWDPVAQKAAWKIPFLSSGGALSTAGQLIFVGNSAGKFFAMDPLSGKTLWETQLGQGVATPISYELDGKQYIAVMSGISKGKVYGFALP